MKTILIGNFPTSIPIYKYLFDNNLLTAVCFQQATKNSDNENLSFWKASIEKEAIETFIINKDNFNTSFIDWLTFKDADLVIVCGFSLKFRKQHLNTSKKGFVNIHFGKLPENKGPKPMFWSIKNGDKKTAITIHKINEDWDSGVIIKEQMVDIIPGETLGMLNSKMSFLLNNLIPECMDLITEESVKTSPNLSTLEKYYSRPTTNDLTINWEKHTAEEIEYLVNACNPTFGGALTYFQGSQIKIIEASPVSDQPPMLNKQAGEIVHANHQEGLFVRCRYGELLKINIIASDAGILTGNKFVFLGIQPGHFFTNTIKLK